MNKYKRKSKTKTLAMGIGILSSAAVVSTGFAAWIIAGGDTVTGTGTIQADTVTNNEHIIDFPDGKTLGSVFFGAPENATNGWLKNDGTSKEKLTIETTFTVTNVSNFTANGSQTETDYLKSIFATSGEGTVCSFAENSASSTDKISYATAKEKGYVGDVPTFKWGETDKTSVGVYVNFKDMSSTDGKLGIFDLKIVFGWGTHFNNENPFVFYNKKDRKTKVSESSDLTYSKDAENSLGELSKIGSTFTLTLVTL